MSGLYGLSGGARQHQTQRRLALLSAPMSGGVMAQWLRLISHLFCVAIIVFAEGPAHAGQASALDQVRRAYAHPTEWDQTIELVRRELDNAWQHWADRLAGELTDASVPLDVKLRLIAILQGHPGPEAGETLLRAIEGWIASRGAGPDEEGHTHTLLSHGLLDWPGQRSLSAIKESPELVNVLVWCVTNQFAPIERDHERFELVAAAPLSATSRSHIALKAVLWNTRANMFGNVLLTGLQESELVDLRSELRESPRTPEEFRYGAATALASLGDPEGMKQLAAIESEPGLDPQLLRIIKRYREFGAAAHSPTTMLDFISGSDPMNPRIADWAIGTARRLGAGNADLRTALDAHAEHVYRFVSTLPKNRPEKAQRLAQSYLRPVKDAAIKAGVLIETDWPDVGKPTGPAPTP